ncbi:MAG: tetratricopeptide repeat protein [Gammaproteobacteria bacterium]
MSESSWLGRSFEELSRRKVFRAGAAYAVVAWLLVQIADTVLPAFGGSDQAMRIIILALLVGFPITIIVAWLYDFRNGGLKRTSDDTEGTSRGARTVDLAIIGVLAVAVGYLLWQNQKEPVAETPLAVATPPVSAGPSVAVLPFDNNSDDPSNEIFADGLAEDLLIRLAKIEDLRVPGPTSSFRYRGSSKDIVAIGRALDVNTILEGSVRAYEGTIKVAVSLVNVADSLVLWSETYTREMTNVFAIQEEIAKEVALKLRAELIGDPDVISRPTESVDAYRLYLRGRKEWRKRTSSANARAIGLFERAIALDPNYAHAWSGLSDAFNFSSSYGNMETVAALREARAAAEKALELDPDLPEAHASMGLVESDESNWAAASEHFQRAIELNPNFANAHMWYGSVLLWVDLPGATEQRRIAAELEPLSPIAVQLYGEALLANGKVDEARRQFLKIVDFAPEYPLVHFELSKLALLDYDYAAAVRYLRKANELDPGRAATMIGLAQIYAAVGDFTTAYELTEKAKAIGPDQLSVIAMQLSLLQNTEDYAAMTALIDARLGDDINFFPANVFRSAIAFQQENYTESARWIRSIFERYAGGAELPPGAEAQFLINDNSMQGVLYLANSYVRSGKKDLGEILANRLLEYVSSRQVNDYNSSELLFVEAGAYIALERFDEALGVVRTLADAGYVGYVQLETDNTFSPIRGELEFKVSVDDVKENAARQQALIKAI